MTSKKMLPEELLRIAKAEVKELGFKKYSDALYAVIKSDQGFIQLPCGLGLGYCHSRRGLVLFSVDKGKVLQLVCPISGCNTYSGSGWLCECYKHCIKEFEEKEIPGSLIQDPPIKTLSEQQVRALLLEAGVKSRTGSERLLNFNVEKDMEVLNARLLRHGPVKLGENVIGANSSYKSLQVTTPSCSYALCAKAGCLKWGRFMNRDKMYCLEHFKIGRSSSPPRYFGRRIMLFGLAVLYRELSPSLENSEMNSWFRMLRFLYALGKPYVVTRDGIAISIQLTRNLELRYSDSKICLYPFCFYAATTTDKIKNFCLDDEIRVRTSNYGPKKEFLDRITQGLDYGQLANIPELSDSVATFMGLEAARED